MYRVIRSDYNCQDSWSVLLIIVLRSILGPIIGGTLAKPCDNFPNIFLEGSIWYRYPYLLPNLFSAVLALLGAIIGFLFLEETHHLLKQRFDPGLKLGHFISSLSCNATNWLLDQKRDNGSEERQPLISGNNFEPQENGASQDRRSLEDPDTPSIVPDATTVHTEAFGSGLTPSRIFTRSVVLNLISYAILAL